MNKIHHSDTTPRSKSGSPILDSTQTMAYRHDAIELGSRAAPYTPNGSRVRPGNEPWISQPTTFQPQFTKGQYTPVSPSRKLNLLLQRSLRYSYRQRCCGCCPTVLCELLFPLILIAILLLIRYGTNALNDELSSSSGPGSLLSGTRRCSQEMNPPVTLSKDILARCFQFPPSYSATRYSSSFPSRISEKTNLVFQPSIDDTNQLVLRARKRLVDMGCNQTRVWSQNANVTAENDLLQKTDENHVIIDFGGVSSLDKERNLAYTIIVRMSGELAKNTPVDLSFIPHQHPTYIADRSNVTDVDKYDGSELPEFSDVKMFVDSLLVSYQTRVDTSFELERTAMICTSFRRDFINESGSALVMTIVMFIDLVFLIPYLILLMNFIREKNAKVKEILKVLGIGSVYNNIAQAIRTLIIFTFLTILLCVVLTVKLKKYAYFNSVNFGILFVSYIIYSLQLISFCIMNAQLFDKVVRAVLGTLLIYGISYAINPYIVVWPAAIQYILIFFSPFIGGYSLFQQATMHDLAFKDVALFRTIYRHVPMYFPTLIVMLCSCVFYWILSWYIEKVFPGQYGISAGWNFLFKRDYWRSEKSNSRKDSFVPHSRSSSKTKGARTSVVRVNHLVKKFGPDKVAVNDVSFDLYENQITSLLGPNGSGKTTIFNCLIGMYRQTSGAITIESEDGIEFDTRTNMDLLRRSMGYCPQHDILFDLLTIQEQLEFYASARGFAKNKRQIASEMLRVVNLENSKHLYCNSLSGGMKRRLSLACAFVGDTKIILLDEPSSGLDPSNRRLLWDWLRSMKEGKTLLLTTHFMEESDALSDRIMIISNGDIKADGTSAKLKEEYGSGYKLVINKQSNSRTRDLQHELRAYLPQIAVETDTHDGDVIFRTNEQPGEQFVQALLRLEQMKRENRIRNYGVQNSTMDDVFLKITTDTKVGNHPESNSLDTKAIKRKCDRVFKSHGQYTGPLYYLSQYYGLLIKTFRVHYRRWALTLLILLLPILYNILSNVISLSGSGSGTFRMKPDALNPQTILYNTDPSMDGYFRAAVNGKNVALEARLENISDVNRIIRQKRIDRPYTYTDIYLAFNVPRPSGNTYQMQALSSNLVSGHEVISVASNTFYKHAMNDSSASIETTLVYKATANFTAKPTVGDFFNLLNIASCVLKSIPISLIIDVFVFYLLFFYVAVFLVSERKDSFLSMLNISGLHPASYWIFNYLCDLLISTIWFCYLLAIYCLVDVAFNGAPVKKSAIENIASLTFGTPWDLRVQFYPLSILIAIPTLPFAYLLTKLFKSDILGGIAIAFMLMILHFVSIIVPIVSLLIENSSVRYLLYWLFNILAPNINAQVIITYIMAKNSAFCKTFNEAFSTGGSDVTFFKSIGDETMGVNAAILVLHVVLMLLLLILIDSGFLQFSFTCCYTPHFDENKLDDDVRAERDRVLRGRQGKDESDDHLTVNDLVKYYPMRKVLAVDHLTFGAKQGEVFGLLGFNGAGKTTTFRIVVGDMASTKGTAFIHGKNVQRRLRNIRSLGYCPQENCSMDFLTVQDGLYLVARMRGVRGSRIASLVDDMSSLFLLDPFLNNYIHQLSGGTKRRLHAALALIGPPLVAILDEPTTGVDPTARQQMQEVFLNATRSNLTIILTSHSMDECERVCNRLGIMVQGQLACLGTIQHLKSKFGQGYNIDIKVRSVPGDMFATGIQNVQSFLQSQRQFRIEVKETTHSTGSFQVEHATPAELFQLLEQHKRQLDIETYTISQTTLEQIFLSFGKQIRAKTQ